MKNKTLSLIAAILILGMLTSCNNSHQEETSADLSNENNIEVTNSRPMEVGSLSNYAPTIFIDTTIIYQYFTGNTTFSVGKYDIQSKEEINIGTRDKFSLSYGIPVLVDKIAYLPITLESGEHNLLRIDIENNNIENIYTDYNSEPLDSISTTNDEIYMLSCDLTKNGVYTSYIRKYNNATQVMDMCILKESINRSNGEIIKSFACNDGKIYVFIEKNDNSNNETYIEVYDSEKYSYLNTLYFDDEIISWIRNNNIAQLYSLGNYIYIRDFSDYGYIGKINGNSIELVLRLPQLRIAYNNKNTKDECYIFFVRESNEFYILDVKNESLFKAGMQLSKNESIRNAISDGSNLCVSILDESIMDSYVTKETYICSYKYLLGISVAYNP